MLNRLLTVALSAVILSAAYAQQDVPEQDESYGLDRAEERSYAPFPDPDSGYVTDLADLLTKEEEERIEVWLWQTESRTNVEIAVVTIERLGLYPEAPSTNIESFATGLFDAWGVGNLPKNDGVLLLVSRYDRKARIELGGGYGRARDADAKKIMDGKIVPAFRQGNYPGGITDGVEAIMLEFASVRVGVPWNAVILAAAAVAGVLIAVSLFRKGKKGWGWLVVGVVIAILVGLFKVVVTIIEHMPEGDSDSWGSGGFGGGFGGGSSGGGGATGSW